MVGLAALFQGLLFGYAGSVWWLVNNIAGIDTADGEPPGPLNGYGVTAVLLLAGIALVLSGLHVMRQVPRRRLPAGAVIALANAVLAAVALLAGFVVSDPIERGVATGVALMAAYLAIAASRVQRRLT
jgi:hypothetical protein